MLREKRLMMVKVYFLAQGQVFHPNHREDMPASTTMQELIDLAQSLPGAPNAQPIVRAWALGSNIFAPRQWPAVVGTTSLWQLDFYPLPVLLAPGFRRHRPAAQVAVFL